MSKYPTRLTLQLIAVISLLCVPAFSQNFKDSQTAKPGRLLFLGDSLTAGYGLSPEQAYPALIQEKIDAAGLPYEAIAAGLSGETSAGGLRRIDWLLQRPVDVLVIALGSNDGLRGISPADTRRNLQGIIDKTRAKYPKAKIVLAGMQVPPNLGDDYTDSFRSVFPKVADRNDIAFIPFLLDGVGGNPDLNIADGIHPNPRGHQIIADTVWATLEPVLESSRPTTDKGNRSARDAS